VAFVDQRAFPALPQLFGDTVFQSAQSAHDDMIALRVLSAAKRALHPSLDAAIDAEREDHPDEERGAEDQRDAHDLGARVGVEQADVTVAHGRDGHHHEVQRVDPREMIVRVKVGCDGHEHRDEADRQPHDEAVMWYPNPIVHHGRRLVSQGVAE